MHLFHIVWLLGVLYFLALGAPSFYRLTRSMIREAQEGNKHSQTSLAAMAILTAMFLGFLYEMWQLYN